MVSYPPSPRLPPAPSHLLLTISRARHLVPLEAPDASLAQGCIQVAEDNAIVAVSKRIAELDVAVDDSLFVKFVQARCKVPRHSADCDNVLPDNAPRLDSYVSRLWASLHDQDVVKAFARPFVRGWLAPLSRVVWKERGACRKVPAQDGNDLTRG